MAPTFFDPSTLLAVITLLFSGGVRDLASCVSTKAFWSAKSVTISFEQLSHELEAVKPADISRLIVQLNADDPKVRDAATDKIFALGPAAISALEETAKDGSPEASSRAAGLLVKIRASAKVSSIRRLMAIRTLGELKDPGALPILRPLLDSREMFEAEYARAAIARIESKPWSLPPATEAERSADVALMPARLDALAQIAPALEGDFDPEKMIADLPLDEAHKAKAREESAAQLIQVLETVGDVRLDAITWGFYAAPPGKPGNTVIVMRGQFDAAAVCNALTSLLKKARKVDGCDVFDLDEDASILVSSNHRIALVAREATGELGLEQIAAAMKSGSGDLANNVDLSNLLKTVDRNAPLWAVATLDPGLKEIVGPLSGFDTATIVGRQSRGTGKLISDLRLDATSADAAQARQAVEATRTLLERGVIEGRLEEKRRPILKPIVDFLQSIKLDVDGGKASATGSMEGTIIFRQMLGPGFDPGVPQAPQR